MAKLLEALMDIRRWDTETLMVKTGPKAFAFLSRQKFWHIILDARQEYIMLWELKLIKLQMPWIEVDLFVSFGISINLQTIEWFDKGFLKTIKWFKKCILKRNSPVNTETNSTMLRTKPRLKCESTFEFQFILGKRYKHFWSKAHISFTSWKNCKSYPSSQTRKWKSKVTIFLLCLSSNSRSFCSHSLIYYRTRVRSLAMLVTNSLTNWLPFSKLYWCDPGRWRWQLKTCW